MCIALQEDIAELQCAGSTSLHTNGTANPTNSTTAFSGTKAGLAADAGTAAKEAFTRTTPTDRTPSVKDNATVHDSIPKKAVASDNETATEVPSNVDDSSASTHSSGTTRTRAPDHTETTEPAATAAPLLDGSLLDVDRTPWVAAMVDMGITEDTATIAALSATTLEDAVAIALT